MVVDFTGIVTEHPGQWVGLAEDEQTVVASGKTVREVMMEQGARKGHPRPILFRVPMRIVPYIGGFSPPGV